MGYKIGYRHFQALKALSKSKDWLTRWKLTRQSLDHMKAEDRQKVLDELREGKLIEERVTKQTAGAGAPALQYRITKRGLTEFNALTSKIEKGMYYSNEAA